MAKKIIKEIFIMLLLLATLALVMAIVFYDYIPINKVVPEPVAYTMPNELSEVKEELKNTFIDKSEDLVVSYSIEPEDLVGFKQTKEYEAGKANPFEVYEEEKNEDENGTSSTTMTLNGKPVGKGTETSSSTKKTDTSNTGKIFETGNSK